MDTLSETRIPSFALLSKTTNIPDLFMWFTKFWAKLIKFPKWLELHHTTRYSTVLLEQLAASLFQFMFALKFWNFIDSYRYLTKRICTRAAGMRWKSIWDNFWQTTLKRMLRKIVTKWSFSVFIQSFTTYSFLILFLSCCSCFASGDRPIHVSYDIDSLDPKETPSTGTPGGTFNFVSFSSPWKESGLDFLTIFLFICSENKIDGFPLPPIPEPYSFEWVNWPLINLFSTWRITKPFCR